MAEAKSIAIPPRVKDLTGERFAQWTVLAFAGYRGPNKYWMCLCDCGATKEVFAGSLARGLSQSCGCRPGRGRTTHGMSNSTEYASWVMIIQRCYNPNSQDYFRYGGRGIRVCDRWMNSFEAFFADMGSKPAGRYISVERLNNDGHYEPSNCVWASKKQQARNTRRNVLLTFDGRTQCVSAWAEELGMLPCTLKERLKSGWSVERALTEPVHR